MSIDVVRDNIARAVKQFAFQHTPVSVTGTTNETTLFSTVIPGGTLGANDVLHVTNLTNANSSSTIKTIAIKFGGNTFFAAGVTTNFSAQVVVIIRNRNNTGLQVAGQGSSFNIFGQNNLSPIYTSIDTSVDQTLAITGRLVTPTNTKSVTSLTRSDSTATATVTSHGYANGQSVLMAGANQSDYNGTFVISNVTANTFNYTVANNPTTPATGTITAALWDTTTLESVIVEVKKS